MAAAMLSIRAAWRTSAGRSTAALWGPVLLLASCAGAEQTTEPATTTTRQLAPTTTTAKVTTSSYPPVPRPTGAAGLVWDSCLKTRHLNLTLAYWHMTTEIYNSDDERRLIYVILADAADTAAAAAKGDTVWSDFAAATGRWRDSMVDPANDHGLEEALETIADTCEPYGLDRGLPGDIPTTPDTAEYGRALACRQIFYHVPHRVGFANGDPFTVENCLDVSEYALQADGRRNAYQETIEAFFALTPGYLCHGEQCWDESDFEAR